MMHIGARETPTQNNPHPLAHPQLGVSPRRGFACHQSDGSLFLVCRASTRAPVQPAPSPSPSPRTAAGDAASPARAPAPTAALAPARTAATRRSAGDSPRSGPPREAECPHPAPHQPRQWAPACLPPPALGHQEKRSVPIPHPTNPASGRRVSRVPPGRLLHHTAMKRLRIVILGFGT
jgi:hypothetical protein